MTFDNTAGPSACAGGPAAEGHEEEQAPRIVIRDKRRLDPQTGNLRSSFARTDSSPTKEAASMTDNTASGDDAFGGAVGDDLPGRQGEPGYRGRHTRSGEGDGVGDAASGVPSGWPGADEGLAPTGPPTSPATSQASAAAARAAYADAPKGHDPGPHGGPADEADAGEHPDTVLAAERLDELKREQARFVNYQRRIEKDRAEDRSRVVAGVLESLVPVLDEIHLARQHGDLESGPMAKIAEKLETVLTKQGVERYGRPGDTFDPRVHEAVMHIQAELAPGTTDTTVVQVMQPGYKIGDRVVRAALVAVADPH